MSCDYPGGSVKSDFITQNSSGAATNADSLPVGVFVRNGADTAIVVTITNKTTGVYTYEVDIPSSYVVGDDVQIRVSASVGGVAAVEIVWEAALQEPPGTSTITSITVEEGAIVPGQYTSIVEGDTYFAGKLYTQAWDESTDLQKNKAMAEATQRIDRLNFRGKKTGTLAWPRENTIFEGVPTDIKIATLEVAYALLDGVDPDMEHENLAAVAEGASSMRTTYGRTLVPEHFSAGIPSHLAWLHLRPLLADVRRIKLRRV